MSGYGERKSRAVGLNDKAFGGPGMNLGLEAVFGEGDMITTFDDFNRVVLSEGFSDTAQWAASGWTLTEDLTVTAVGDLIWMNDPNVTGADFDSCIRVYPGTADDAGGQMKLTSSTLSAVSYPHIWIPGNNAIPSGGGVTATKTDETTWVFACRIGLQADNPNTAAISNWTGGVYIGWAGQGDTSILDHDTKIITVNGEGPLVGFHVTTDGEIRGVSKRVSNSAAVEGTSYVSLVAAGGVDSTVANGAETIGDTMWFDLALRLHITDRSSGAANGFTTFSHRGPLNSTAPINPGHAQFEYPGEGYPPWIEHTTTLIHAGPNESSADLIPTIEVINGPTANEDCVFYLDWWAMGCSRPSRGRRV